MSALQQGDIVLITGGTGWVGSHIVNEALIAGLRVKLAIRSEEKAKTLIEALNKIHGKDIDSSISTTLVKDFGVDNAYDEAVKGVQGIIHVASNLSFSDKAEEVIPPVIKSYKSLLEAANNQKDIRRVIITSSAIALGFPNHDKRKNTQHFNVKSWNDDAVEIINSSSSSTNALEVYAASKVLSEKVGWDFIKEKKPNFIINVINPNVIKGAPVPGVPYSSSGLGTPNCVKGVQSFFARLPPQWHVDVDDVAKLHIIAAMREDVKNERILAFGTRYNYNIIIDLIKKLKPDANTPEKQDKWEGLDNTTVNVSRANELLKEQGGLHDLEYSIRRNLQAE